jgi:hypothetical protein
LNLISSFLTILNLVVDNIIINPLVSRMNESKNLALTIIVLFSVVVLFNVQLLQQVYASSSSTSSSSTTTATTIVRGGALLVDTSTSITQKKIQSLNQDHDLNHGRVSSRTDPPFDASDPFAHDRYFGKNNIEGDSQTTTTTTNEEAQVEPTFNTYDAPGVSNDNIGVVAYEEEPPSIDALVQSNDGQVNGRPTMSRNPISNTRISRISASPVSDDEDIRYSSTTGRNRRLSMDESVDSTDTVDTQSTVGSGPDYYFSQPVETPYAPPKNNYGGSRSSTNVGYQNTNQQMSGFNRESNNAMEGRSRITNVSPESAKTEVGVDTIYEPVTKSKSLLNRYSSLETIEENDGDSSISTANSSATSKDYNADVESGNKSGDMYFNWDELLYEGVPPQKFKTSSTTAAGNNNSNTLVVAPGDDDLLSTPSSDTSVLVEPETQPVATSSNASVVVEPETQPVATSSNVAVAKEEVAAEDPLSSLSSEGKGTSTLSNMPGRTAQSILDYQNRRSITSAIPSSISVPSSSSRASTIGSNSMGGGYSTDTRNARPLSSNMSSNTSNSMSRASYLQPSDRTEKSMKKHIARLRNQR